MKYLNILLLLGVCSVLAVSANYKLHTDSVYGKEAHGKKHNNLLESFTTHPHKKSLA